MPQHTLYKHHPLGSGGGGSVYHGQAEFSLGQYRRPCAVKLLHESMAEDSEAVANFAHEAAIGYQMMGHPHVVGIRTFGTSASGQPYLVMDVEGPTLRQLPTMLEPSVIWRIAEGCVRALLALEAQGCGHGDINLGNIFIGRDGGVKLGDLGKSMGATDDRRQLALTLARLTVGHSLAAKGGGLRSFPAHVPTDLQALIRSLFDHRMTLAEADAYIQARRGDQATVEAMQVLVDKGLRSRHLALEDADYELDHEEVVLEESNGLRVVGACAAVGHRPGTQSAAQRRMGRRIDGYVTGALVVGACVATLIGQMAAVGPVTGPEIKLETEHAALPESPESPVEAPRGAPVGVATTVNRATQSGDVTAVLSHVEHEQDRSQLHVVLVNGGAHAEQVDVVLAEPAISGSRVARDATPTMVPAHATVHRVVEMREGSSATSVTVQTRGAMAQEIVIDLDRYSFDKELAP